MFFSFAIFFIVSIKKEIIEITVFNFYAIENKKKNKR